MAWFRSVTAFGIPAWAVVVPTVEPSSTLRANLRTVFLYSEPRRGFALARPSTRAVGNYLYKRATNLELFAPGCLARTCDLCSLTNLTATNSGSRPSRIGRCY